MEIPIFPLGSVLFPHMPMALHIFEDRYRTMMRDCEAAGIGFGVVAIQEGFEVGGMAKPYRVGTLAKIRETEQLDDGRYNLIISGASRFRIRSVQVDRPYLVGDVELLPDEGADGSPATDALVSRSVDYLRRYVASVGSDSEIELEDHELPRDPELLSYIIAAVLQVETAHKQELLEATSATTRLRLCLRLLRREHLFLERMMVRSDLREAVAVSPN